MGKKRLESSVSEHSTWSSFLHTSLSMSLFSPWRKDLRTSSFLSKILRFKNQTMD